jgi:hypothetical protein
MRRLAGDVVVAVQNPALAWREETRDDGKQRGLAGAVRADQRDDLALLGNERGLVEREQPAEAARDVFDAQKLMHGVS